MWDIAHPIDFGFDIDTVDGIVDAAVLGEGLGKLDEMQHGVFHERFGLARWCKRQQCVGDVFQAIWSVQPGAIKYLI